MNRRLSSRIGSRRRLSIRRAGLIFLSVGIGLFLILGTISAVLLIRNSERSDWPRVQGRVVEVHTRIDRDRDSDGDYRETTLYRPEVEYAVDGENYRFTSRTSRSQPWTVGDPVEVVYNPADPSDAFLAGTGWVPWMLAGMALVFGVVFGGAGVAMRRTSARR